VILMAGVVLLTVQAIATDQLSDIPYPLWKEAQAKQ
jgi:hypothetical protein